MFDISFEINGKKVKPDKIGDIFMASALKQIAESLTKDVGKIRCNKHGEAAKIVLKGRSLDKLSPNVSACCEDLIDQVESRF